MASKKKDNGIKLIKDLNDLFEDNKISTKEIVSLANIDYPLFSFKWLQEYSFVDCKDAEFFHSFLMRLQKLSSLGWNEIRRSNKHGFGMEKIPRTQIKSKLLPSCITPDVDELHVFRAHGDNRPMVGIQENKIFHVIFIEGKFGDVYDH